MSHELDTVIHTPVRLRIVATLATLPTLPTGTPCRSPGCNATWTSPGGT
jgi:hypothetical protein